MAKTPKGIEMQSIRERYVLSSNTPYTLIRRYKAEFIAYWCSIMIVEMVIFRFGITLNDKLAFFAGYTLKFIYPALYLEINELSVGGLSTVPVPFVMCIFAVNSVALYVAFSAQMFMTLSHAVRLKVDGTKVIILSCVVVASFMFMGKVTLRYGDLFTDVIDIQGIFIIKRTVLSACAAYFMSVIVANLWIASRNRYGLLKP